MGGDEAVGLRKKLVSKQFVRVATGATAHCHERYADLPGLSAVEGKLLTATFDAGRLSSDGGMIAAGYEATCCGPIRP